MSYKAMSLAVLLVVIVGSLVLTIIPFDKNSSSTPIGVSSVPKAAQKSITDESSVYMIEVVESGMHYKVVKYSGFNICIINLTKDSLEVVKLNHEIANFK